MVTVAEFKRGANIAITGCFSGNGIAEFERGANSNIAITGCFSCM